MIFVNHSHNTIMEKPKVWIIHSSLPQDGVGLDLPAKQQAYKTWEEGIRRQWGLASQQRQPTPGSQEEGSNDVPDKHV
jgi:hypothetical protein